MPKEVYGRAWQFLPREQLLSYEEIERLAHVFAALGVEKIRLTGGEPLVRHHVQRLVAMLAEIPGLDLTMTTNGSTCLFAVRGHDLRALLRGGASGAEVSAAIAGI